MQHTGQAVGSCSTVSCKQLFLCQRQTVRASSSQQLEKKKNLSSLRRLVSLSSYEQLIKIKHSIGTQY